MEKLKATIAQLQDTAITQNGLTKPATRVVYSVGQYGPFSVEVPKDEDWAPVVQREVDALNQRLQQFS